MEKSNNELRYVSKEISQRIGEEYTIVLEEFCICLSKQTKYDKPIEVIKSLFELYDKKCSGKWVVPLTANAISQDYESSYNNPYYTTDILSNMRSMLKK